MLRKVIPLIVLVCAVTVLAAVAQDKVTFEGKIEEIAVRTTISPVGQGRTEKNLAIKLDSKPNLDISVSARDAVKFGLIDTEQPSAVLAPGRIKGVGWKVRLTCDKKTNMSLADPFYIVTKLERLD